MPPDNGGLTADQGASLLARADHAATTPAPTYFSGDRSLKTIAPGYRDHRTRPHIVALSPTLPYNHPSTYAPRDPRVGRRPPRAVVGNVRSSPRTTLAQGDDRPATAQRHSWRRPRLRRAFRNTLDRTRRRRDEYRNETSKGTSRRISPAKIVATPEIATTPAISLPPVDARPRVPRDEGRDSGTVA